MYYRHIAKATREPVQNWGKGSPAGGRNTWPGCG